MYKVEFTKNALKYLEIYFRRYREYYQNLYEDSGLWNEQQIISWYNKEAKNRMQEIIDLVDSRMRDEKVLWRTLENTIFLKWKTKLIFIKWTQKQNLKIRYIKKIEIR